MSKYRKRFSQSEKLEILNYYKQYGGARTKRRYNVSITSIYRWHDTLENEGPEGLHNPVSRKSMIDPELERLRRENNALKALVADKELELRIKDAMLKKSQ